MKNSQWKTQFNFPAEQELIKLVEANPHMFGAMMQIISLMWHEKDPVGAKTIGPCYAQVETYGDYFEILDNLTEKDAAIKTWERKYSASVQIGNNDAEEVDRLRKALEEAVRKYETGDMESDFADILDGMYEICKGALGEGDKE
ncbi:hypothetical protein D3C76_336070 [compost metagenome]